MSDQAPLHLANLLSRGFTMKEARIKCGLDPVVVATPVAQESPEPAEAPAAPSIPAPAPKPAPFSTKPPPHTHAKTLVKKTTAAAAGIL